MFKFHYHNRKKSITGNNCSGLQNGVIRGLQIGAGLREYKSGQEGLQIGAILVISNEGKKNYKSGRIYFKSGKRLQMGPRGVSIGAGIANW